MTPIDCTNPNSLRIGVEAPSETPSIEFAGVRVFARREGDRVTGHVELIVAAHSRHFLTQRIPVPER